VFAVAVLLSVLTGCGGGVTGETHPSTPRSTSSPTSDVSRKTFAYSTEPVTIEPGTYQIPRSEWSIADFTVTFPPDWTVQYGHDYLKHSDAPDEFGFYAVVVDAIYPDACEGSNAEPKDVGPNVDDLAAALLKQSGPTATDPVDTTLGGYPATRIDLTVPEGFDLKACNVAGIGLQIWYSPPADKNFVLLSDGTASVYIVDVDGQRQVFLTQYRSVTSHRDLRELQAVLASIQIEA